MIDEKKLIKEMERWATSNFSVLDDKYEYRLEGMIKAQDIVLAQPQVGGWIPVTEKLPENGCGVLVTVNGKHNNIIFVNALEIAEYRNTEGWIIEGYLDWLDPDVTAWMPLPEPYKESKEE